MLHLSHLIKIAFSLFLLLVNTLAIAQNNIIAPSTPLPVDPNVKTGQLKNGLTYYIRKNDRPEDRMELRLVINAGSILETEAQLGLAHFMEHMNFNGTENFARNDIVDYLQSIGVKFGADLNAYTSFDETVYILPVPTNEKQMVDQSFQILEDWAHNALLEEEEIDKERGVVLEEWRIGRGANQRMLEQYLPVLLKGSRYAERLPIGKKEVLENFKPETLREFYRDWYRPDLMAVIAVGDLDVEETEKQIKAHFGSIEMPEIVKERPNYDIPDHEETLVAVAKDKEASFTSIRITNKMDAGPRETVGDYRREISYLLYTGMPYMERNNTESSRYVRDYINNFLEDEPIPGIEFEYNYVKSIIDSITIDEVNALTSRLLSPVNRVIIITAPDKEEIVIPQEPELLDIVKKAEQKELMPYRDKLENAELLEEIPVSGKIIEEETISGTDIDKWTLSNGAVVFLKKTDFKQDEALFSGYSKGGTSLYPMEDYYSATYSDGVFRECGFGNHSSVDLQKLLSGKTASINTYISQNSEGLSGSARPKDLETMFKLAYLKMTAPRRDTEIFASYIAKNKSLYQNLLSNPNYYFLDQSIRFMSQNHPRASGFPKAEEWDKIDLDRATAIYQDRFQNPGDFFFVIVGNFDKTMIRSLVETYIGGIAAQGKNETPKDLGIRPPQGNKQLDVYKGEDDKSSVKIHYHGLYQYDRKTNFHLTALADLLDIRLVEILREEKGGVYGVGASFSGQKFPYEHYRMSISFPCSPNNVDELIKATLNEINDIKENGVSEKNLQKIKEGKLREMEVKIKENNYWLSAIQAYQVYGYEMSEIEAYQSKIEELESEDIRNAALKYLDGENIATLILWPESFEKKP
jgi:predicted Zn-dependent peptidase